MVNDDRADSVATAILDGRPIDWTSRKASRRPLDSGLLESLRVISRIGANGAGPGARERLPRLLSTGFFVVLLGACAKLTVAGAGLAAAAWRGTVTPFDSPLTLNWLLFAIAGVGLLAGGTRDRRLRSLGALFLLIAAACAGPVIALATGRLEPVGSYMRAMHADAFLALGLWLFVWQFPSEPGSRGMRRLGLAFLYGSTAVGVVLFAVSAAIHLWRGPASLVGAIPRLPGTLEATLYWPLLFGVALPAIPFLMWKARAETPRNRRKVHFFVSALALGLLPILLASIAAPAIPQLSEEPWQGRVGLLVYLALGSIVPTTVYAVAVERVMDLHLVIRRTVRYALARTTVQFVSIAPLLLLSLNIYRHRGDTLGQYLSLAGPISLMALSGVGFVLLTFRHEVLRWIDRYFLRETADHTETLARLERSLRTTRGIRDLARVLTVELRRAFHPASVGVLVLDGTQRELVSVGDHVPPLRQNSALLDLLRSVRAEVQIGYRSGPVAELLPEADRTWLADTGFQLFFPLIGTSGGLVGLVGLGRCLNDLPYTERDCMLITAMCGQVALKLENNRLRELSAAVSPSGRLAQSTIDWDNEPAMRCPECDRVSSPTTRHCSCGAATIEAALPLVVSGKFHVQSFIGAGGTGVVYLGVDVALDRQVAIKTLPAVRLEHASRLHREARAMATVLHPNLALIYGAEYWKQTPLLIFEYLEGGTLTDSLKSGPIALDEVLDLGTLLADALERVHASGILHRDIKPSNIGYNADGVPKLLDFGLAAILDGSRAIGAPQSKLPSEPGLLAELVWGISPTSSLTITQQLVGTPLYLSPEAVAGQPPQASFDLWSLSLVLYEAFAGRHPLAGLSTVDVLRRIHRVGIPDIREIRPECPALFAAFLREALSLDLRRRPETAGDLRNRLRSLKHRLFPIAS